MACDDPVSSPETIAQAVRRIKQALETAGIDEAAGDARRLIAAALDITAATIIGDPARPITHAQATRLATFVSRRCNREPVSRILGTREFYGRPFTITPAVLDPRADTETLIECALSIVTREGWRDRPITILDIGTGSGAILLTLLAELPHATGVGLDISHHALAVAKSNASTLNLTLRSSFHHADICAGVPRGYDLVVSNPPYIPAAHIPTLDPEVAKFDPHLALDGGADGFAYYRSIVADWAQGSRSSATARWLVLEAGVGQSGHILEIARSHGLVARSDDHRVANDLGGHERCIGLKA
jgi:release factor glutamine methyltransferase